VTSGEDAFMKKKFRSSMIILLCVIMSSVTVSAGDKSPAGGETPAAVQYVTGNWTGDFDGMVARNIIRVLVVFNKTMYFLDGPETKGITYEAFKEFETFINKRLKKKTMKTSVVFIPVRRDQLIPFLLEGRGDIAAANLTVTPERIKKVDFSDPFLKDVSELVVTGPAAPPLKDIKDLSGKEVHVRRSSSYYESLSRINDSFRKSGRKEMSVQFADESLEDEDLLEMVNAGLIPMVIVDNHKAQFWAQIFDEITVHADLAVNTGGDIAWAFRKNSPKLRKTVNDFVKKHKKGTLIGNILFNRYLKNIKYVKNSLSDEEMNKFKDTLHLFKRYSDKYQFDYLMVGAQAYQESGLDHSKRSRAGAVGIMQILPSTAADPRVNIYDIEKIENNIHAGIKYLRFVIYRNGST
jgi:membrane-bound lytic murein transglycosylase MltF